MTIIRLHRDWKDPRMRFSLHHNTPRDNGWLQLIRFNFHVIYQSMGRSTVCKRTDCPMWDNNAIFECRGGVASKM